MATNNPLYTTEEGFKIYEKLLQETLDVINNSDNPRIIVIQTWIIIDFCIREMIITGLKLNDLEVNDFDPRYSLLPQRLEGCIELIKKIIKCQKGLKKKINNPKLGWSLKFLNFIKKDNHDFFDKLMNYEQKYYKQCHPEYLPSEKGTFTLINPSHSFINGKKINYQFMEDRWLETANKIDKNWEKAALAINSIRNSSAHSFDIESIYKRLGINGKNQLKKLEKLKIRCKEILNILLNCNNEHYV